MIGWPKRPAKKRRKKHQDSILQRKDGTCYLCRMLHNDVRIKYTEEHHIFYGTARREKSEAEGLKVYLCEEHHRTGREAVHLNHSISRRLQAAAQKAWEEQPGHDRKGWMDLMGRNYRDEEDEDISRQGEDDSEGTGRSLQVLFLAGAEPEDNHVADS